MIRAKIKETIQKRLAERGLDALLVYSDGTP